MTKTIQVRYRGGILEPLEPLALEEGAEMTATLTRADPPTAGTWESPAAGQHVPPERAEPPGQAASGSSAEKPRRKMGADIIVIAADFDAPITPEEEELFGL